ncbi:NADH-quinone oxidoreductase subunit J, partial [Streptomyces sp. DH37]
MITGATIGFYLLAIVAILASLRVITRTNPVHALLNMIVTLLALSGIFFALGAPFAGALEIIVYAGAIMVLFVFVVMMLNLGIQSTLEEESWLSSSAWAVPAGLAFIVGLTLFSLIGMKHGFEGMMPAFIGVE